VNNIVVVSGYFNPIHTGHIDYLKGARKLGTALIVIVNNDAQVRLKGSVPFMSQRDRLVIVNALECVSDAVPSIDTDGSVVRTLRSVRDKYHGRNDYRSQPANCHIIFANGGDRKVDNIPEYDLCESLGIEMAFNVGGGKTQSSSELLEKVK
jgi:cytidyltransferase-like protein